MNRLKNFNILLLEDNVEFAKNTIELLNIYFKNVSHSTNIKDALNIYKENNIDVIISDIKLKDENGLDFIKKIRLLNEEIPIVVLSAHKDEEFLFKAIPLKITSYELKPLNYENFMLMLSKIAENIKSNNILKITNNIYYNLEQKLLYENNEPINLTKKEMLFLELLLKDINNVVTFKIIQDEVWENKVMSDPAVKNFVFRFRKKIKNDFLSTVQGIGYKIAKNQ